MDMPQAGDNGLSAEKTKPGPISEWNVKVNILLVLTNSELKIPVRPDNTMLAQHHFGRWRSRPTMIYYRGRQNKQVFHDRTMNICNML